jgi:hypothetical protein
MLAVFSKSVQQSEVALTDCDVVVKSEMLGAFVDVALLGQRPTSHHQLLVLRCSLVDARVE